MSWFCLELHMVVSMYSESRNTSGSRNYRHRHRRGPGAGFGAPGGGFGGPGDFFVVVTGVVACHYSYYH